MYDPQLGRFHVQDAYAEKYLSLTPYHYSANNPIFFIDINGDSIVSTTREDDKILIENSPLEEDGENFTNTIIISGGSIKESDLSDQSVAIVNDAMIAISDNEVVATSGKRDAENQARIMYNNLEGTGEGQGVEAQKKLYGANGGKVIDTYVGMKKTDGFGKLDPSDFKQSMENKINQLGPGNVSPHCSNKKNYDVFDIGPSSVSNVKTFQKTLKNDSRVTKIIPYPKDPGIHIEVKY